MKKLARYILTSDFWKMRFCALKKNHAKSKRDFFTIINSSSLILYNTTIYISYPIIKEQLNRSRAPFSGLFFLLQRNSHFYQYSPLLRFKKKSSAFSLIFRKRAFIMNKNTFKGVKYD